jgi:hypothetical protein
MLAHFQRNHVRDAIKPAGLRVSTITLGFHQNYNFRMLLKLLRIAPEQAWSQGSAHLSLRVLRVDNRGFAHVNCYC